MAVRKVVTRSGHGVRGYFPSRKMRRMVAWESQLERDAILLLEFSTGVLGFWEQPAKVYFDQDGERHLYIPDFEAKLSDGRVVHMEIKPESKLRKSDIASRFAAITAHYTRSDIGFSIFTEKAIRQEPRLSNLRLLAYHQPEDAASPEMVAHLQKLVLLPAQTIAGAAAVLGDVRAVYQLLAANAYGCDLDSPISGDTRIFPIGKEACHETLFV